MITYSVGIKVWYKDGTGAFNPRVENSQITCNNFAEAAKLALDDEGGTWEYKRAKKEVVFIIKAE